MRRPTYVVELSEEERARLETLIRKGKSSARKQTRARILLKANAGLLSQEIEQALNVSDEMVYRARQRFVEEGLEAALNDRPRPGTKPKLMDKQCAHLIAVACSDAPEGHGHWTLRLLADKAVELGFAESLSHEAVWDVLKKTASSRGKRSNGASPEVSADFVAAMEDVLELYEAPYDAKRPMVCFDESPKQLIAEVRPPLSAEPGQPARYDVEYKRRRAQSADDVRAQTRRTRGAGDEDAQQD